MNGRRKEEGISFSIMQIEIRTHMISPMLLFKLSHVSLPLSYGRFVFLTFILHLLVATTALRHNIGFMMVSVTVTEVSPNIPQFFLRFGESFSENVKTRDCIRLTVGLSKLIVKTHVCSLCATNCLFTGLRCMNRFHEY